MNERLLIFVSFLPIYGNIQGIRVLFGEPAGIADYGPPIAALDYAAARMNIQVCSYHYVITEHFHAITSYPVRIVVAHTTHDSDNS